MAGTCRSLAPSLQATVRSRNSSLPSLFPTFHCTGGRSSRSQQPHYVHAAPRQSGDDGQVTGAALESDTQFWTKLLVASTLGATAVKYGSLAIDAPFTPNPILALAMIFLPALIFGIVLAVKD